MFIAVDGIDGAGKTTLVKQLAHHLAHLNPLTTKEPTSTTSWGQRLRQSAFEGRLSREKEIEFFHLDRLHHLENKIKPALVSCRVVICDRYVDSTLAFQTGTPAQADQLFAYFAKDILVPDVTFILKCHVSVGMERIIRERGKLSKFEDLPTLEKARSIYESRSGDNYEYVDASGSVEDTLQQTLDALIRRFPYLENGLIRSGGDVKFSDCGDDSNLKIAAGG
ncbi:MAG: dTMP kinase [Alphaproteobacteria bacterium]|nr:dTMP kinase [Alphaproteobacteria bacterium]